MPTVASAESFYDKTSLFLKSYDENEIPLGSDSSASPETGFFSHFECGTKNLYVPLSFVQLVQPKARLTSALDRLYSER